MSTTVNPFVRSVRLGVRAARVNYLPAMLLWLIAVGLVVAYYQVESVRELLAVVGNFKERFGFLYSAVATALAGGLFPLVFQSLFKSTRKQAEWRHLPFFLIFWATKGLEVDLLYRTLAWGIGEDNDPATIITKVALDMFGYAAFWAVPTMTLAYMWKDNGYCIRRVREKLGRHWYRDRMLPVLITNLVIWIPSVAAIYSFPSALQLPVQNIILSLFVLLVLFLTKDHEEPLQPPVTDAHSIPGNEP